MSTTTITSLDGFRAASTAQRADGARAYQASGLLSDEVNDE